MNLKVGADHQAGRRSHGIAEHRTTEAMRILQNIRDTVERNPDAARASATRLVTLLAEPADHLVRGGLAPWARRCIEAYLKDHLAEPISVDDLAMQASLSVSYFHRAFKQTFGQSPRAYVTQLRVELAQKLMLTTAESLAQIALASGFAAQSHMTSAFVRLVGVAPGAWRRRNSAGPLRDADEADRRPLDQPRSFA